MSKKQKFYIPLLNSAGTLKNRVQLINSESVKGLSKYIPNTNSILKHLIEQKTLKDKIKSYQFKPITIRIDEEVFDNFVHQLKKLKPGTYFTHNAFDIILDSQSDTPIVQITK